MTPPPNEILLVALESAVAADPVNTELRTHLAGLLLEVNRPAHALEHCTVVLQEVPDHAAALRISATAADRMGQPEKAARYRRVLDALGSEREPAGSARSAEPERISLSAGSTDSAAVFASEKPSLTLADVAGLDEVKRRLDLSLFAQIRNPELRKYYGRSMRGGLLLYGPPGCGKTFVARATAGELAANFIAIGLHDVLDMYLGESERKLHEIFENARRTAPCVLFIDEIDALGRKRSLQMQSAGRDLVNQLLSEMDSLGSDNQGVFILGATNHPWEVDTALRRPGRFDRTVFVAPPDEPARQAILEFHMRERTSDAAKLGEIAVATPGYSGADLAHLCDTAAERAMEDSIKTGIARPIQHKDFVAALKEVKPSTSAWLETARSYATFANEAGAYDEVLEYLRNSRRK